MPHAPEFRLFISSTFIDLQPEREQLIKKVFPRIRALCRERGVEFTEIDLRWGITQEESRTGRTIRICLEEIDRSPYFIGILGSRYGWRPGFDEVSKDPELVQQYPWLAELAANDKSIIEMEMTLGAASSHDSAFIYEQTANLHLIEETDRPPFGDLKDRLSADLPYRKFASPEELGDRVYEDLVALLDRDFPAKSTTSAAEAERQQHEAFVLNRTRSYIANLDYYKRFEDFVASDGGAPLLIWGRSGLGKSALMAFLSSGYKQHHPDTFIIRHFVGATAGASTAVDVMRHIMLEIKERYDLPDELPTDDAKFTEDFPSWLAKVRSEEKLVLAIDAVNQLSGIGNEMHWLPEFIPANVRLVISTTPDVPLEQLRKRNYDELEIEPLDAKQRARIATEFLERYHKRLAEDQLALIAGDPKLASPLFLRTVLEELRIHGRHTALGEHLQTYLACTDERDLFHRVLSRMERDHGADTVRLVMTAIWASRFGLTETELMEVTGLSRLALSEFLIALEFHLMRRRGLFTFFHNYLREAVELRYLPTQGDRKAIHSHVARYFATREYDVRRRDEEPWQWQQAEDPDNLKACLMEPMMVAMFSDDKEVYEHFSYWKSLPEIGFDEGYVERLKEADVPDEKKFEGYRNIISLLVTGGKYEQAENFLESNSFSFSPRNDQIYDIYNLRFTIENHLGHFDKVIKQATDLLNNQNLYVDNPDFYFEVLDQISYSYFSIGQFADAEQTAQTGLNRSIEFYGEATHQTAMKYKNLSAIQMLGGKLETSEDVCRKALQLYSNLFGSNHPESAQCLMNLATCLMNQKKFENAAVSYQQATEILTRSLGQSHPFTLQCGINIAYLEVERGNIIQAREKCLTQLDLCEKVFGVNSLNAAIIGVLAGFTYYKDKDYGSAKTYYQKYLPIFEKFKGESHPDTIRYKARLEEINEALKATPPQK